MQEITIETYAGVKVLRDDLLIGGTKSVIMPYLPEAKHYVYASPVYGGFQIALAEYLGSRVTIFCAKRKQLHSNTLRALYAGAIIEEVPHGYLSVVEKAAREYAERAAAYKIAFGAADFHSLLKKRAKDVIEIAKPIKEIWCAIGSGTLFKSIVEACEGTDIKVHGVSVGKEFAETDDYPDHYFYKYPRPFDKVARMPGAPFSSMPNYDLKAWEICTREHGMNALFWNVL